VTSDWWVIQADGGGQGQQAEAARNEAVCLPMGIIHENRKNLTRDTGSTRQSSTDAGLSCKEEGKPWPG